jgi:hypothetical protein
MIEKDDLFKPIQPECARHLTIMEMEKSEKWEIYDAVSESRIALAFRDGKVGGFSIKIFENPDKGTEPIGVIHANFTHSTFSAEAWPNGVKKDIGTITFGGQKRTGPNTRQFSVSIPDPRSYSNSNKKSAIKLRCKVPNVKGGIPVLFFGGRVKMQSVKNHILIRECWPDDRPNNIFVFGKAAELTYVCDIFSPLSTIQGICLALPHIT